MYCTNCGKKVDPDHHYCTSCGEKINHYSENRVSRGAKRTNYSLILGIFSIRIFFDLILSTKKVGIPTLLLLMLKSILFHGFLHHLLDHLYSNMNCYNVFLTLNLLDIF